MLNLATKCDSTCAVCAREFFKWYKTRMKQMEMVRTNKGETVSFAEAAATSVRAD